MKATGIILSECCDAPIVGEISNEWGRCSDCKEMSWAYDTGLAQPLTRDELFDAAKDELTDEQIKNNLMNYLNEYEKQIDIVFDLHEQKAKLNSNMQRDRWKINIALMAETKKAQELDEKISTEHFPLFKTNYLIRKHNEATS